MEYRVGGEVESLVQLAVQRKGVSRNSKFGRIAWSHMTYLLSVSAALESSIADVFACNTVQVAALGILRAALVAAGRVTRHSRHERSFARGGSSLKELVAEIIDLVGACGRARRGPSVGKVCINSWAATGSNAMELNCSVVQAVEGVVVSNSKNSGVETMLIVMRSISSIVIVLILGTATGWGVDVGVPFGSRDDVNLGVGIPEDDDALVGGG